MLVSTSGRPENRLELLGIAGGFADEDQVVGGIKFVAEGRGWNEIAGIATTVANLSACPDDGMKNLSLAKIGITTHFGFSFLKYGHT
ncbi:hypothetical protein [Lysobacter antibioticus]|uniref:hypothetical protein n=1 Tax=Lysobacter antibioticus TaxID=84531 RepID=UPI0007165C4F|nr:hypothetical protein [Lysobacter antibioticus]